MFYNRRMNANQPLAKMKSSYDKLQKALNEPTREYNAIKDLVEARDEPRQLLQRNRDNQDNGITNIKNIKNNDIKNKDITAMMPKQKQKKKNKNF